MKILLIGTFKDISPTAVNSGYQNAVGGISYVLQRMKKENIIEDVDMVDSNSLFSYKTDKGYDISLSFVHPSSFLKQNIKDAYGEFLKGIKNNILNVVWETEPLPETWEKVFKSSLFSHYTAPSEFVVKQLPEGKRYYLPHFVKVDKKDFISPECKKDEFKFTCLMIGQYTKRKGLEDGITGFVKTLGKNEDCQLIIKYHYMKKEEISFPSLIKNLTSGNCTNFKSEIYVLEDKISFKDIVKLYQTSSLFMNTSRGEGFGLCSAEAMAIGIPVIYTNWSALKEVSVAKGNIPIDYTLDYSAGMSAHGYEDESYYAVPKIESICNALKTKYSLWKRDKIGYYKEVSENHKIVEEKFGYEAVKKYLLDVFKTIGDQK